MSQALELQQTKANNILTCIGMMQVQQAFRLGYPQPRRGAFDQKAAARNADEVAKLTENEKKRSDHPGAVSLFVSSLHLRSTLVVGSGRGFQLL